MDVGRVRRVGMCNGDRFRRQTYADTAAEVCQCIDFQFNFVVFIYKHFSTLPIIYPKIRFFLSSLSSSIHISRPPNFEGLA